MNVDNFVESTPEYMEFATQKSLCKQCSVYDSYKTVVQSEGNVKNPTFMFVGEAAGNDEVEHNKPFIGRAGQRLRQELRKYQSTFNKKTCLISNVLPCRPKDNQFPQDKNGVFMVKGIVAKAHVVISNCTENWLLKEIALVRPKIIVTLGAQALNVIRNAGTEIHERYRRMSDNRGSWVFLNAFKAWSYATYHPSYVLRCSNGENSLVESEFEFDIKKIADTWEQLIESDPRMFMSDQEFKDYSVLQFSVRNCLAKDSPIPVDDPELSMYL